MPLNRKTKLIGLAVILALISIFFIGPVLKKTAHIPKDNFFQNKTAGKKCHSDQSPVFTHHITELDKIKMIVPPGSIETYEGEKIVKSHSYVLVQERVPVYAPADGLLVEGARYLEEGVDTYYLHFQASCEITYRFDHIVEPMGEIKDALPPEPAQTTHTTSPKKDVEVKAGQLIGYSMETPFSMAQHGIWLDFGVVNTAQRKNLSDLENQGLKLDERDYQSVCPYDFFPKDMRGKYYSLFGNYKDNGIVPTVYCK